MKKRYQSTLTSTFICFIAIMVMFSCESKKSESSTNNSDSISESVRQNGDSTFTSINFSIYTISKSYLDALPSNSNIIIFQAEFHEGEFQLNAYYSKPGGGQQKEYERIPDSELIKGDIISLSLPFSIGNNQIPKNDLRGNPPHDYQTLQINPLIIDGILLFELEGLPDSSDPLNKISLGRTNPSPPATSFE